MKDKLKSWLVPLIIVAVLAIPIVVNYVKSKTLTKIDFEDFTESISTTDFALTYIGDLKADTYSDLQKSLVELKNKYDTTVEVISKSDLTDDNWNSIKEAGTDIADNAYVFVRDGEIVYAASNLTSDRVDVLINKYLNNVIPDGEVYYKTFTTYKEYMKLVNSKNVTMAVFGRNSCTWCNKFKPIYNDVANEYNVDIYYVDSDSFDSTEYSKILNSGLKILAKCNSTGEESLLSDGFGTPLTIFTKNGETVDCISGYTNKTGLVSKLTEVGLIK